MPSSLRPYVTAGVALVGASLIVVTPAPSPRLAIHTHPVQLTSTGGSDDAISVIDAPNHLAGIIVGGSGIPIPQLEGSYVEDANDLYIQRILPGAHSMGVFTPEGASPIFSGVQSLPIDTSLQQDVYMMNSYVTENVAGGNTVAVYGESQSAMASSELMPMLQQEGIPADAVKFVLVGDVDNPDGGWGARFDATLPAFTTSFNVSTPADTPYDTTVFIQEYDGFSDFPKYPLNVLSDLNAILGLEFVHPTYRSLTPADLDNATLLPGSMDNPGDEGAATATNYYIVPMSDSSGLHEYIPLLVPLTDIPVIGKPLADLLNPAMEQLVNLGYDNPANEGWDVGHANVPTGFGVLPSSEQFMTAMNNLGPAIQQGFQAFSQDLSDPSSLLAGLTTNVEPSTGTDALSSPTDLINAFTAALSQVQSLALPIQQSVDTLVITVPTDMAQIFVSNISDPLNALGLAAGAGVAATLAVGGIDVFSGIETLDSILGDFGLSGVSL